MLFKLSNFKPVPCSWLEACHELSAALDAVEAPTRITTWQAPVWAAARFNPNYRCVAGFVYVPAWNGWAGYGFACMF